MEKILVILGPTASGKSALAVKLAKKFKGEIISADSRQVYKGLDIGTGKITKKEMGGIPHHLLDIASPKKTFTVVQYKKLAEKTINKIIKKGKLPIVCGGTGFYIQAVVDNMSLPEVKPNVKLRRNLEKKSVTQLGEILKKLDPKRYRTIDTKNARRLIRAIEIAKQLGHVPTLKRKAKFDALQIGISTDNNILQKKIRTRLLERVGQGMAEEVKHLRAHGLSFKRLESFGLEYKYIALYLQKRLSKNEMLTRLESEIKKYAKRQKTWFKKDTRIKWFTLTDLAKIEKEVKFFTIHQG
ncbi:MAG: tRNA (adenosine(37)-N6)-dimethylallyltransferase MiaA [Patescibacteria group bacterium]|nr:tRNA (adenosine(37)-N6)-dimethylallyltransferase MiaA [bacterium]MDZ4240756.1 tRNA (adenosine(37)-N6)-dimethylallyltransferase MiaA [Patescibacteria group bacterium]